MQSKDQIEDYLSNTLSSKLIDSNIPDICKREPCILGIDEAGRGPVLGPMSYAIAYHPEREQEKLEKMKFADSKALTAEKRESLFENIGKDSYTNLGFAVKIISPNVISNSMLRR